MMIVTIPEAVDQFIRDFCGKLSKPRRKLIPMVLTGILLARGNRTLQALARTVAGECRHRSNLCRFLARASFRSRDLYTKAMNAVLRRQAGSGSVEKRTWVVIIDGTDTKRGGFSKIENARQFKKKKPGSRGAASKSHTFVMGLLITEAGMRIPLPRRSWYSRAYCKKHNKKYRTQLELAAYMLRKLDVPEDVEIVVLADEYFESEKLWNLCGRLGFTWITPAGTRRNFGDEKKKRTGKRLHDRGRSLPRTAYTHIELVPGEEETASYRRHTQARYRRKKTRRYRVACDRRVVAKLGDTLIVYSWKSPVYRPERNDSRETFKVLLCNRLDLTPEEVVEWYELRWQIELFFRELKSSLGLGHYRGGNFQAYERYIDLVLLAFLFLEWHRVQMLESAADAPTVGRIRRLRTSGLQDLLVQEATAESITYCTDLLKTEEGRRELAYLFPALAA